MADQENQHANLGDSFTGVFKTDTPPKDFFDLRKTSIPPTYEVAKGRVEANLVRFKTYYFCITLLFMLVFILLRPSFGFFLGVLGVSYYLHLTKPTIKGHKLTPVVLNLGTGACLLVCAFLFSSTLVSILALTSLISITVLGHALTFEKAETGSDEV